MCVCENDDGRGREVIGDTHTETEESEYERASYPLVVVGLFKPIVVVDGKRVWDS